MASVPNEESNSGPAPSPNAASGSLKETASQESQDTGNENESCKTAPSFVQAGMKMDANSVRDAILGASVDDGASVAEDSASLSKNKKKKKKKRPKSAQSSPSSESVLSNPSASGAECGAQVTLTESLEAMSVSEAPEDAAAAAAAGTEAKQKKKKKKKGDRSESTPDTEGADVEMKDVEREGSTGEEGTRGSADQGLSNLQQTVKNLLNRQKKGKQQPCQQTPMMPQNLTPHHNKMQYPMSQHTQQPSPMPQQQRATQQQIAQQQGLQGQTQGQGQQQHQQQNKQQKQKGKNSPKKKQQKKNVFDPYWPMEEVSAGLKRGTLIEGAIRINPRNYEDAYVPLPDGTADIFISGMADRNRALNGDVVAVLVQDRDNWRVFTEEVDQYEKYNSPLATAKVEGAENDTTDASNEQVAEMVNEAEGKEKEPEASGETPDVLVEEEQEVELDSSGKPIEETRTTKPVTGSRATPAQNISTPQPTGSQGTGAKDKKGCNKGQGSNCKGKRYKSVKEVMDQASPVVRRLFDADGSARAEGEEGEGRIAVNTDKFMQRTGKVVAILRKKHSRASSGNLRPLQDNSHNFAVFAPSDPRVPRIMIPTGDLPQGFKERPEDFTKVLYIARITEWNESSKMPKGALARSLGEAGQLEPETEALLAENNIDSSDFSEGVLACLPQESPWTIPAEELQWRRDLRKECIFTIDPSTARDLDDALHCTDLGDGLYEVGVHIADVSYFVKENTELDEIARSRATSVYLVQKVIPMLPRLLCEQLCSLNPDEDRLSFSVIWKIREDGQILEEWFGRTVIRSCVKLSYDHAQGFIEQPDREWTKEELPPLSEGFTVEDIKTRVLQMDKIAKALRKARFDGGALRLDQVKIQFTLNKESGLPNGYFVYDQRDSNKLVEEFMLLANMAVAQKIRDAHREKAVLRRHPPPQSRMINDLKELCKSLGFPIEVDCAKDIQLSLARYIGEDELSQARLQILVALCSRPMRNAKYFCCGMLADEMLYSHYALNVPLYTHFTSPIRRYPDILVHRTLAAALDYCEVTERSPSLLQDIAEHCNDMKTNAKMCSEKSNELYFSIFVKETAPIEEKGMVMSVLDKSFDVFILNLGVVKRVYCEKLPLEKFFHHKEGKRVELTLMWKPDDDCPRPVTQKLAIFSAVNCVLQSEPEPLKWSAFIRRPVDGDVSIVM